jgi:uncharacterized protein (UPF0276 family)
VTAAAAVAGAADVAGAAVVSSRRRTDLAEAGAAVQSGGLRSLAGAVGIGYREPWCGALFSQQSSVDCLEIIADRYLETTRDKLAELDLLARHFVLIPHGINLSIGSADGVDERYIDALAELIERMRPPYWSEHLSYSRVAGVEIGHLSPLPRTHEALEAVRRNVQIVRRRIGVPLVLENIAAMVDVGGDMSEAEFLTRALEENDCGLLLDVNNLYTNATNEGYDAHAFIDALPLERLVQLHLAGGEWRGDVLVDTHSQPTPEPVWNLATHIVSRAPHAPVIIIERDENLPPFADLATEVSRARALLLGQHLAVAS